MQKLYFESAWDKTIAPEDRKKIVNHFKEQEMHIEDGLHFSFLWKAKNHKGERLITVLIHNANENNLFLRDTAIAYYEQNQQITTGIFDLPYEIAGKTTMPWTFIFSQSNQTDKFPQYTIINEDFSYNAKKAVQKASFH